MRKTFKKLIAIQQIFLMIFSAVISLLIITSTKSQARLLKDSWVKDMEKDTAHYQKIYTQEGVDDKDAFVIFADNESVRLGLVQYVSNNSIIADQGAVLHIGGGPKDNFKVEVWSPTGQPYDVVYSKEEAQNGIIVSRTMKSKSVPESICLRIKPHSDIMGYTNGPCVYVTTRINQITLESNENNAAIKGDTIYMAPGARVPLSTVWATTRNGLQSGEGSFEVLNSVRFSINGRTLIAPNNLTNNPSTVSWKSKYFNGRNSCSALVKTSTLGSTNLQITSGSAKGEKCTVDGNITTVYTLGVNSTGSNSNFTVRQGNQFYGVPSAAVDGGLSIEDVSGCLSYSKITPGNGIYSVALKAKKSGAVKVKYYDYSGRECSTYWNIVTTSVSQIKSAPPADTGVEQSQSSIALPNVGASNPTTSQSTEYQEWYSEPVYSQPEPELPDFNDDYEIFDGNYIHIKYNIPNATDTAYKLVKWNPAIKPRGISSYNDFIIWQNYNVEKSDNPNQFDLEIRDKSQYESGYYLLYVVSCNEYSEDYAALWQGMWLGPDHSYDKPEISQTSEEKGYTYKSKFKIENGTETSYMFVKDPDKYDFNGKFYDEIKNGRQYTTVKNAGEFTFETEKAIIDYEDGEYGLIVFSKNQFNSVCSVKKYKFNLGKSSAVMQKPSFEFKCDTNPTRDNWSELTTTIVNINNCDELKYAFIPLTEWDAFSKKLDNKEITYDNFDGIKISNPATEEVVKLTYNPDTKVAGKYMLEVMCKNKDSRNSVNSVVGAFELKSDPPIVTFQNKSNDYLVKKIKPVVNNMYENNAIKEMYLYVKKYESYDDYTEPSVDEIKKGGILLEKGANFTSLNTLGISEDGYERGYYDLFVYIEDINGSTRLQSYTEETKDKIVIGRIPTIDYEVAGEKTKFSIKNSDNQSINVKVSEEEYKDKLQVTYFITDKDLTEDGKTAITKKMFDNPNGYEVKTQYVENGKEINIPIPVTKGKIVNKYVYILAKDRYGIYSCPIRTGAIRVDGTELKLEHIYANKEIKANEKTGIGLGQELKITMQFNHTMSKKDVPSLAIKMSNKETRYESSIEVKENEVIYTYPINNSCKDGDIEIVGFTDDIKDNYKAANKYTYNKSKLKEQGVVDDFTGKYYFDIVAPKIENIEIKVETNDTAEELTAQKDTTNNTQRIKSYKSVNVAVTYDSEVVGASSDLKLIKGNQVDVNTTSNEKLRKTANGKTTDIYDFTELLQKSDMDDMVNSEGELVINYFTASKLNNPERFITDKAGNVLNYSFDKSNVKYILNGKDLGNTKLLIDNQVLAPQIYVKNSEKKSQINLSGTYAIGTEFIAFAEFNTKENCKDISGIETMELCVVCDIGKDPADVVEIKDKSGAIVSNYVQHVDVGDMVSMYLYPIEPSKAPVTIKSKQNGEFHILLRKYDGLDNIAAGYADITISDKINILLNKSGLLNTTEGEDINVGKLDSKKQYDKLTYTLKLDMKDIDPESVKVYYEVKNNRLKEATYVGAEHDSSTDVDCQVYSFIIEKGGSYNIIVKNLEGDTIYTGSTLPTEAYLLGDTDYDGELTPNDLSVMLKYIARRDDAYNESVRKAGDVFGPLAEGQTERSGDGSLDVSDAVLLCRYLVEDKKLQRNDAGYMWSK